MEKQTVRDKLNEIIGYIEDSEEFNINQIVYDAMKHANRWEPTRVEHKYLDYYTYEVTKKVIENVTNVLLHYAEEGRDSYIDVKKRNIPEIKIGDIRGLVYDEKLVKMRLSHILWSERKQYVFVNCDQTKFVRPMVIELFEDEVNEKAFKLNEDIPKSISLDEFYKMFSPNSND